MNGCDHVFVAGGGAAARRHGPFAFNRYLYHLVHATRDEGRPYCFVAEFRCACDTQVVTSKAHRLVKFFARGEVDVTGRGAAISGITFSCGGLLCWSGLLCCWSLLRVSRLLCSRLLGGRGLSGCG